MIVSEIIMKTYLLKHYEHLWL